MGINILFNDRPDETQDLIEFKSDERAPVAPVAGDATGPDVANDEDEAPVPQDVGGIHHGPLADEHSSSIRLSTTTSGGTLLRTGSRPASPCHALSADVAGLWTKLIIINYIFPLSILPIPSSQN